MSIEKGTENLKLIGEAASLFGEVAMLLMAATNNRCLDAKGKRDLGLWTGKVYVVLGLMMDLGVINSRDIYEGRLNMGERMAEFMDRYPIENNHPDLKRLFTDVRREVNNPENDPDI